MSVISDNFEILFKKVKPQNIRSDRGKEFENQKFKSLCSKYNINHFVTQNSTTKCAIVERFNRTLKTKIERYMNHNRTRKFVDALKSMLNSYNNSTHRTIKMAPSVVSYENESEVFENSYGENNLLDIMKKNVTQAKFQTGDTVRYKYDAKPFDKMYRQRYTDIVYKVLKVIPKLNKYQYELEYRGNVLKRRFYPEELQKVKIDQNTLWPIEKIVRRRVVNNRTEVLIKWRGHYAEDNSWIPLESIQRR